MVKKFIPKRKALLSLSIIGTLAFGASQYVIAAPTTYDLGVTGIKQAYTNWCWAATSASILNYNGNNATQNDFVKTVKGKVTNQTATFDEIKSGFKSYGYNSTYVDGSLSYSSVKSVLYSTDQPIMVGITNNTTADGHIIVFDGYDDTGSGQYVSGFDPSTGLSTYGKYSGFSNKWIKTLYKFN